MTGADTFADAFSRGVRERGVSLEALHRQLAERGRPVSVATLSYWRSGQRRPERPASLAALGEVEDLLGLEPGELTSRLGPSRRTGRRSRRGRRLAQLMAPDDVVREALLALGGDEDPARRVREISTQVVVQIDPQGRTVRAHYRVLWQVLDEAVAGMPFVFSFDEPTDHLELRAVRGCRISGRYRAPDRGVQGVLIDFGRARGPGERVLTEHEVLLPPITRTHDSFQHHLARPCRDLLLLADFHPDRRPPSLLGQVSGAQEREEQLRVAGRGPTHLRLRDVGPGTAGLRWEW